MAGPKWATNVGSALITDRRDGANLPQAIQSGGSAFFQV
jgi:hypothetical protein